MLKSPPRQFRDLSLAETTPESVRRRRRLGLATSALLYVLVIGYLFLLDPHPAASALALVPGLLVAALYEIPGGLAGALIGTLIVAAKTTLDAGWPWPAESRLALLISLGSFVGLGLLVGWLSQRERERDELVLAALAETDEQRRQFLAVLENAPFPVVMGDGGGRLRMANRAALDALGLKPPVALGQDIASLVPDIALADLFYQAMLSNEPISGEVSGTQGHTLLASLSPVPGVGTVAVLQDITHLVKLNQRKKELISTVSHDLKNPLAAIQGYADLVSKAGELNERQRGFIERVHASAARITALISDLLDMAWLEAGMETRRERTDLAAIALQVVKERQTEAASKSLQLTAEADSTGAYVLGDELRLRQMIDNLVANAIQYTDEGGQITISLKREEDKLLCRVQDTSAGIAKEDLDKVFERYFRVNETADQVSGSGLGLTIVRAIATQHDGSVRVESEQGKGSTFIVELPAAGP